MGTRNRTRQTGAKILGRAFGQIMNLWGPSRVPPGPSSMHPGAIRQIALPKLAVFETLYEL